MNQCKAWPAKSALIVALTLAVVAFVMVHLSILYDARLRGGIVVCKQFVAYNSTTRAGLPRKLGLS